MLGLPEKANCGAARRCAGLERNDRSMYRRSPIELTGAAHVPRPILLSYFPRKHSGAEWRPRPLPLESPVVTVAPAFSESILQMLADGSSADLWGLAGAIPAGYPATILLPSRDNPGGSK